MQSNSLPLYHQKFCVVSPRWEEGSFEKAKIPTRYCITLISELCHTWLAQPIKLKELMKIKTPFPFDRTGTMRKKRSYYQSDVFCAHQTGLANFARSESACFNLKMPVSPRFFASCSNSSSLCWRSSTSLARSSSLCLISWAIVRVSITSIHTRKYRHMCMHMIYKTICQFSQVDVSTSISFLRFSSFLASDRALLCTSNINNAPATCPNKTLFHVKLIKLHSREIMH